MQLPKISIIIPVLNEAETLSQTLATLPNSTNIEIIVVDGGSQDNTTAIAQSWGIKVLFSERGRANQMNAGAAIATGDILLFLHADTRLPDNFDILVDRSLFQPQIIAGAFELKIDRAMRSHSPANNISLRFIEQMVNLRSRYLQLPYGDQAIFLTTAIFHQIGAFSPIPIMEDFELIQRLKKIGKIAIVPESVLTSARRWEKLGVIKTTLINQAIVLGYFLGVSPDKLARFYHNQNN